VYSSPLPCYLVPLRPKNSPLHPIFKHPQPTLLPHCEKPSFRPTENNWQNYSSAYLNLCIFVNILEDIRFCTEW
jgi:hypothetical protein